MIIIYAARCVLFSTQFKFNLLKCNESDVLSLPSVDGKLQLL